MMNEEISYVILIAFGAGALASVIMLFTTWIIVSVLNIFKKIS